MDFNSRFLYAGEFKENAKHGVGKSQVYATKEIFGNKVEGLTRYTDIDV